MYYFSVTVFEGIMIKASELRIGNLVAWKGMKVCNQIMTTHMISAETKIVWNEIEVKNINDHGINEDVEYGEIQSFYPNENIFPIPLTEEWLIKFGFASNEYKDEFYKSYIHLDCEYTDHNTFNVAFKGLKLSIDVKYVHQLQNLFHALTGEELTIK